MASHVLLLILISLGFWAHGSPGFYSYAPTCVANLNDTWTEWSYSAQDPLKNQVYLDLTGKRARQRSSSPVAWLESAEQTQEARGNGNTQLKEVHILGDPGGPVEIFARFGHPDPKWVPLLYGRIRDFSRGTRFQVKDVDFGFHFEGSFEPDKGEITFDVRLKSNAWKARSGSLSGSRLFEMMMGQFETYGPRVISGNWYSDTNFTQYQRARLRENLSPESAAAKTWTGQQALSYGFSSLQVKEERNPNTGKVQSIHATFRK